MTPVVFEHGPDPPCFSVCMLPSYPSLDDEFGSFNFDKILDKSTATVNGSKNTSDPGKMSKKTPIEEKSKVSAPSRDEVSAAIVNAKREADKYKREAEKERTSAKDLRSRLETQSKVKGERVQTIRIGSM
eukprot:531249-Amorphochlora_amoeboformis.AAC.1